MKHFFLIIGILSSVIFQSCEKENDSEELEDNIEIISVSPSSGLVDGVDYDFTVTVEYNLVSVNSGLLMIGFNTEEVDRFIMISEASTIVDKGSGTHTFNVTATAKDWLAAGDFKVYVNLSENPHPSEWAPFSTDLEPLSF
jgi:hypothetical protein